jgi:hypothetical protein
MVTKEEWAALDKRIEQWAKWHGEKTAQKAKAAAQSVKEDARVEHDDLHKPTTI